jgi:NADPH-dependent 2,4-dienoyl-CoA reductase/sulfur reductase-like enzyme
VIIGLGAGGFYAAKSALATNRDVEVIIIDKKDFELFSPCGMPFVIEGVVKSFEHLIHAIPEQSKRLTKLLKHEVTDIDVKNRTVNVKYVPTNETKKVGWDSLIIDTGSNPIVLPIPGAKELLNKGMFTIDSLDNAKKIDELANNAKKAAVIGAGAIGLEIAVALKERGLDVVVAEKLSRPLPKILDEDIGEILKDFLTKKGIKMIFGGNVERINGNNNVESISINGEAIKTDLVVMSVGVKANTDIVKNTRIKTGQFGIVTTPKMETNVNGIYAVGDCAETLNLITKKPASVQLATTAYKQGIVAGVNAAGGSMEYPGSLGTFGAVIGELEVAGTGLTSESAKALGYDVIVGKGKTKTRPEWMSESTDIAVKIIVDASNGKILGGQSIGGSGAASRINVISTAIRSGMNIFDISSVELAYCPKISEMYDALSAAVDVAVKKLSVKGTFK